MSERGGIDRAAKFSEFLRRIAVEAGNDFQEYSWQALDRAVIENVAGFMPCVRRRSSRYICTAQKICGEYRG